MFGDNTEDTFANNISASDASSGGSRAWLLMFVILSMIALFSVWAYFTEIEQVTTGQGRVIPSSHVQVVQTLEGGIVSEISVNEGDFVEKDQALMQIDDTGFSSQLGELRQREFALIVERHRLEAEAERSDALDFPQDLQQENRVSVAAELQVFNSRKIQLKNELDVLDNRLNQRRFELLEVEAQQGKLAATLAPLQREADLTERMVKRGIVPEVEFLRLKSRLAELKGELEITKAAQPKIQASIDEALNLVRTTQNNYVLSARERLAKLEAELAVVQETIKAASDRVRRALVRAPVRGIVNKINVATIGAVLQPGRDIMEIVPIDDALMIETRIRPQDVAFIKPNEEASVKLTAYDYLIYGDIKGRVVRIGADTIADANGDQFYQVIVRADQAYITQQDNELPVIPGMVATVDIKSGTKTVMSYLMKPILRAKHEALNQR